MSTRICICVSCSQPAYGQLSALTSVPALLDFEVRDAEAVSKCMRARQQQHQVHVR